MLSIDIIKGYRKVFINKVSENDTILALFDDEKQKIDLSCIKDRRNEKVIVTTYIEENDGQYRLDTIETKILEDVEMKSDGLFTLQLTSFDKEKENC